MYKKAFDFIKILDTQYNAYTAKYLNQTKTFYSNMFIMK